MYLKKIGRWLVIVCLLANIAYANEPVKHRPKIALVLSGGGAKGTAHVGVLKVLEELRIPVDMIIGTSIGSVVGGLYALGYDAKEVEAKMLGSQMRNGYSDAIPRSQLPYRNKMYHDQFNIPLEVGISDGKVKLPAGALQGQSMQAILSLMTGIVPQISSFDDLPTPYRAIATDLSTREMVILDRGSIVTAMRASSSVPGALAPVEYHKKLLIDGGAISNIPISVARQMGADIIIAVDIGSPLKSADEIQSGIEVLGIMNQLSSFLMQAGTPKELSSLSKNDILISPNVIALEATDFSVMPKALEEGEIAARAKISELRELSLSESDYKQYQQEKTAKRQQLIKESIHIHKIVLNNRSDIHPNYIKNELELSSKTTVTMNAINKAVQRVYATDEFKKVEARIFIDKNNNTDLHLTTREKSWGPNFVGFGFGWEEDLNGYTAFNFDTAYTMTNLTDYGAQWRNKLELGEDRAFHTEFYAPLTSTRWLYSRIGYDYATEMINVFNNNQQIANYTHDENRLLMSLGVNFTHSSFFEAGIKGAVGDLKGNYFPKTVVYHNAGLFAKLGFDKLDNITFPTKGSALLLQWDRRYERVTDAYVNNAVTNLDFISTAVELKWQGVLNFGNQSIITKMGFSRIYSKALESVYITRLGGFLELSGFHKNELSGSQKALAAVVYQWDLGRSMLGMSQYPLYLGVSLEKGGVTDKDEHLTIKELVSSGSVFLGTNTVIGPAAIGVGATEDGDKAIYLFVGRNF